MNYYLQHHGIKGMKWGVRRFQDKNGRLTSAGKKRYHTDDNNEESDNKFHLSDKQKRAVKIGAAVAATALIAYGGYKLGESGALDKYIKTGKELVGDSDNLTSFKMLKAKENLSERVARINPLKGTPEGKNNCTACAVTTFMRGLGYDVTAKGTGGQMKNLAGVVQECFDGAKVVDGSATKFGKSTKDAAEMLTKRFGENASGVCGISFKRGGGHAFNWEVTNGKVSFFDGQQGLSDASFIWNHIDVNGPLTLARLDNAIPNLEGLMKYMNSR